MGFFIWYDMVKELQKYHTYKHLITSFKLVDRNTAYQQKKVNLILQKNIITLVNMTISVDVWLVKHVPVPPMLADTLLA